MTESATSGEPHATPGRVVVMVVAVFAIVALLPLERVVGALRTPFYDGGRHPTEIGRLEFVVVDALRYLGTGMMIDAFGTKRVVSLAIIVWCVVAMASGVVSDPLAQRGLGLVASLAFGPILVAPYAALRTLLPSGRFSLPTAVAHQASYIWVLAVPFVVSFLVESAGGEADRDWQATACDTAGAGVLLVWLALFREPPLRARLELGEIVGGIVALARRPLVQVLLALEMASEITFHVLYTRLPFFLRDDRGVSAATVGDLAMRAPYLAIGLGSLAVAVLSDRALARGASLDAARRLAVIGAFGLVALAGVLPLAQTRDLVVLSCLACAGAGAQLVILFAILDLAPRRLVGTLVGLSLVLDVATRYAADELALVLYRPTRSFVPILLVAAVAALVGALATHRWLRGLVPLDEAGATSDDISAVF